MRTTDWSPLRTAELALAVLVALVVALMMTNSPLYPSWPTLGGFPVDPELVIPGLLGVVALARAMRAGLAIGPVAVGILAAVTVTLATLSLHTLYTGPAGAFAGGLFTLVVGVALAFAVVARNVVHEVARRGLVDTA